MDALKQLLTFMPTSDDLDREAKSEGDLHYACYIGDAELLTTSLLDKDDINTLDSQGRTPLYVAVQKGHAEVATLLLNNGADPNITYEPMQHESPLHVVLTADTATQLIEHGAHIEARTDNGDTPLHRAARYFRGDVIRTLISNKANVNAVNNILATPLHLLCEYADNRDGFAELALNALIEANTDINLKDIYGKTALHYLAASPACHTLQFALVSNGAQLDIADTAGYYPIHHLIKNLHMHEDESKQADILKLYMSRNDSVSHVDYRGRSALHILSEDGNADLIQLVITEGGSVHIRDNAGRSPLHCISNKGDVESSVNILVSNSSDVDAKDAWGRTPLVLAVDATNQKLCETLLKKGAGVNVSDKNGNTALHIACYRDAPAIVEVLIRHNANVHSRDAYKATPLHAAAYVGGLDCAEILIAAGAEKHAKDSKMKCPFDVAQINGHIDVLDVLSYDETGPAPKKGKLTSVAKEMMSLETALQMIEDGRVTRGQDSVEDFLSDLLESPATGRGADEEEAREIQALMETVIETIAKKLAESDHNFQCTILHAGSTSEGTKTRCPDEFDFMLCLEKLSELVEPEFPNEETQDMIGMSIIGRAPDDSEDENTFTTPADESVSISDYTFLKVKDVESANPFRPFLMMRGSVEYETVPCCAMYAAFSEEIAKILFSQDFPKHPQLIPIDVTIEPAMEFCWHGARYKDLKIGVDLVPAIRLATWPERMRKDCKLFTPNMLKRACLVVPKMTSAHNEDLWRCSLALLETNIFRCLRPRIRNSYIACKCMISSRLLPLIDFGDNDDVKMAYKFHNPDVTDAEADTITFHESVEGEVPSYIIKMTFLSVLEDRVEEHGIGYVYDMAKLEQDEKNPVSTECSTTGECSDTGARPTPCVPDGNDTDESSPSGTDGEVSVQDEWYGPALTMNSAVRSTDFDITIVRDVFQECARRLERQFVPSVFNPNHNILGNRLLSGDVDKALVYIRMINALLA